MMASLKTHFVEFLALPSLFYLWWKGLNQRLTCNPTASLPPVPLPVRVFRGHHDC